MNNLKQAVILREKALRDLEDAERMIREASETKDVATAIMEIDEQMTELQEARDVLERKLLILRFERNELTLVTVREASMMTGMGEMTIRTLANPKRANPLELVKEPGEYVKVTIDSLRKYIKVD